MIARTYLARGAAYGLDYALAKSAARIAPARMADSIHNRILNSPLEAPSRHLAFDDFGTMSEVTGGRTGMTFIVNASGVAP